MGKLLNNVENSVNQHLNSDHGQYQPHYPRNGLDKCRPQFVRNVFAKNKKQVGYCTDYAKYKDNQDSIYETVSLADKVHCSGYGTRPG